MRDGEKMTDAARSQINDRGSKIAASTAGVVAAGALASAACCILPFALPAAILAASGGMLAWLANIYPEALVAAIVLVAAAWVRVAWQSWRTRKRPAGMTMLVMLAASLMLALAHSWSAIEPIALSVLEPQ